MSTTTRPLSDHSRAVVRFHERLASGGHEVPVRLWDGRSLGPADAGYRVVLRHPWSLRAALVPPNDLTIGEAYLADDIDVEGSMVAALRELAGLRGVVSGSERVGFAAELLRLPRPPKDRRRRARVRLQGRRHTRRRDASAVRHHYDQETDFYRCFLDPQLVYSCAYFTDEDRERPVTQPDILARAQERKLELICRKLDLRPDEHFLDVGCGWGSLVVHAAKHHGVRAVGVTLSPPQAVVARERVAEAGLDDRVRIEVLDYRDVAGTFDAIASIGMVEHVGADHLPTYAATLHGLLTPGGRLLNHGITTGRRDEVRDMSRDRDTFIGRYVFPDGALVPAHHGIRVMEQAGFEITDVEQLRPHYARTLAHWVANLEAAADQARRVAGERIFRTWRAYMAGSVVGFEWGDLGVVQILGTRESARLPLGRDRLFIDR